MAPADENGSITPGAREEPSGSVPPPRSEEGTRHSRIGRVFSGSRERWRLVYRDPEHVAERLTLYTADRLASPSREWAKSAQDARPSSHPAQIAEELRTSSAHVARIDG